MNLGLYFYQARRWVLLAVIPAMVVGLLAYFYLNRQPKIYPATVTLYVQQPSNTGSTLSPGNDVFNSEALIPTYSQMLTSPVVANAVNNSMAAQYPGYRLENHQLSVGGNSTDPNTTVNTQLMDVKVTDTLPARAQAAANTVAAVFIKQVSDLERANYSANEKIIDQQLNVAQANVQAAGQQIAHYSGDAAGLANLKATLTAYEGIYTSLISSAQDFRVAKATAEHAVTVFSPAQLPSAPIDTKAWRTGLLLALAALIVCGAGVIAYDYVDDTARTPEEVEKIVGAPILGTVPRFSTRRAGGQLITARAGRTPLAEAYRVIRTNLQFINIDHPPRSIVITSPSPMEGKSTTVSNLANVFAEAGRRVTLVDADLRRPTLHRIFGIERQEGLTNALVGSWHLNGHWGQPTEQPNLTLIASGAIPPRPADLLGSERMRQVVQRLADRDELVLLDAPPVMAVTDAAIISTITDGVVLVVDPAKSKRRDLRRTREAIEAVGGKILGVVINRLDRRGSGYFYYYYVHNYGYAVNYDATTPREDPPRVPAGVDAHELAERKG
jgi:non-specific protein-tyrosine kinase